MCLNAGSNVHDLGVALARLSEAVVCLQALLMWGVDVPVQLVTFDLCHVPPTLTLAHPNLSPSVNEHEDPGAIVGSVWLEDSLPACEGLAIVLCSTHPGIGSCHCVGVWH